MKKYIYALIALLFFVQISFAQNPTLIYSTNGFKIYPVNQHAGKLFLGFDGGNVNDILTWNGTVWIASPSGSGNVFLASNNVFTAINTFNGPVTNNGTTTTSNLTINGFITQTKFNGTNSFNAALTVVSNNLQVVSNGVFMADFSTGQLYSPDYGTPTINFRFGRLFPTNSAFKSLDWQLGSLFPIGSGFSSLDWNTKFLANGATPTLYWGPTPALVGPWISSNNFTVFGAQTNNSTLTVSGQFNATGIRYPLVDGTSNQVVTTDGAGNLSLQTVTSLFNGGNVFTTSNNTFTSVNTFNGVTTNNGSTTSSNLLVRGTLTVQGITTLQTNTYIYSDGTSSRLGINTNVPGAIIDIHSGGDTNAIMERIVGGAGRNGDYLQITNTASGNIFSIDKNGISTFGTNIVINGFINQTQSLGGSNIFVASTNSFSGILLAPSILGQHKIAGITFNNATIGSAGSIVITASSFTVSPSATPHLFQGIGMTITNSLTVSNALLVGRSTTLGTNGSAIIFVKTATASLDFPSILAAGSADLTITVAGCNTNDIVSLGRPADEDASLVTRGFVSPAGTVIVRANNVGSLAVDQGSKTYRVDVIQH